MKELMTTVQLRSTIFVQQNFGYTPETAKEFASLLLPGAKECGIAQPGVPMLGVNPTMPQYGLSWRLFKRVEGEGEYNIAFQPGKIDIILTKESAYLDDAETAFCKKSIDWFKKILSKHSQLKVLRIAYAPLYAIQRNGVGDMSFWGNFLRKPVIDGTQAQDVNLQFLLKRPIDFGGRKVQMNLLHQFFDGTQTKTNGDTMEVRDVLLVQLDLNSVPEKILDFGGDDVATFFDGIISVKNTLIDNVEQ